MVFFLSKKTKKYLNELKSSIANDDLEIENEVYYEWKIENWNQLSNIELSPDFSTGNYKWQLELYKNGNFNKNFISVYLHNKNVKNDSSIHIPIKFAMVIRNYNDPTIYEYSRLSNHIYINKDNTNWGFNNLINKSNLNKSNKPLLENNKCIIGIYLKVYKYKNEQYLEELKNILNVDKNDGYVEKEEYFEWKIENWKSIFYYEYSPKFNVGGYKWKFNVYPNGNNMNKGFVSTFLINEDVKNNNLLHIPINFVICIRNYNDPSKFFFNRLSPITYFDSVKNEWGFPRFIDNSELNNKSIIQNNKCIIGVYFKIFKIGNDIYKKELKRFINDDNNEIKSEGLYEWKIENWNILSDNDFSPEFSIDNCKWKLKLKKNDNNNKDFISLYLNNINATNDYSIHIPIKYILYIRNYNDPTVFILKDFIFCNFNENSRSLGYTNFLKKSDLFNKYLNKSILEKNKCIIGVYYHTYKYEKEQYKNDFKKLLDKRVKKRFISDGFYEWKIENWNQITNECYSPEFVIGNFKWKLGISLNNGDNDEKEIKDFISFYLNNVNVNDENENSKLHVCINDIRYVRNYYDDSCIKYEANTDYLYYNKNISYHGYCQFIEKSKLYYINENINKPLIENNKCIFGVYLRIYEYDKETYLDEFQDLIDMNYGCKEGIGYGSYEWKIENWNQLSDKEFSSEFKIDKHKWKLELHPNNNHNDENDNNKFVSLYLRSEDVNNDLTNIYTQAIYYIKNYKDYKDFSYFHYEISPFRYYNKENYSWGKEFFIKKSELFKKDNKYNISLIENNKCVIGVFLQTFKFEKVNYIDEIKNIIFDEEKILKNEGLYEWEIKNWNQLSDLECSPEFIVDGYKWKLELLQNGDNEDGNHIIKLINLDIKNKKLIETKIVFYIRNYKNPNNFITFGFDQSFNFTKNQAVCESSEFKKLDLFERNNNSGISIIENNKCVLGVYFRIYGKEEEYDKKVEVKKEILSNEYKTPTNVIAISDFNAFEYDQLDLKSNELLVVTDWNYKDGWVFGHRKDIENEKGIFPKVFVKIFNENQRSDQNKNLTPEYRIKLEEKINQFRSQTEVDPFSQTKIPINRSHLFDSAYDAIMSRSPDELKKNLCIEYEGENGVDAGGLLRDFFYQISKKFGDPNYSLFQYSNDSSYELKINPGSGFADSNHLKYFKFIGRILGLAILHQQYLSVTFNLLFFKRLLNKPLELSDLKYYDPEIYKSITWLKNNEGAENLYLTFETEKEDCYGEHKKIELKPNGANIFVNDSNKNEYIDLIIKSKLNNSNDEEQFNSLKEGFYEIVSKNINTFYDENDLKFVLSGITEIDIDDWENNTEYEGYTKDDITIVNFWNCVRSLDSDKQTQLLIFVTGNSQAPVTGFKDLQGSNKKIQHFKIKRYGNPDDLPVSHTCFNRIDLPPYTSKTQLKQKLLRSIAEGLNGFQIS